MTTTMQESVAIEPMLGHLMPKLYDTAKSVVVNFCKKVRHDGMSHVHIHYHVINESPEFAY